MLFTADCVMTIKAMMMSSAPVINRPIDYLISRYMHSVLTVSSLVNAWTYLHDYRSYRQLTGEEYSRKHTVNGKLLLPRGDPNRSLPSLQYLQLTDTLELRK